MCVVLCCGGVSPKASPCEGKGKKKAQQQVKIRLMHTRNATKGSCVQCQRTARCTLAARRVGCCLGEGHTNSICTVCHCCHASAQDSRLKVEDYGLTCWPPGVTPLLATASTPPTSCFVRVEPGLAWPPPKQATGMRWLGRRVRAWGPGQPTAHGHAPPPIAAHRHEGDGALRGRARHGMEATQAY